MHKMNVDLCFATPLCYKNISIDNNALEEYCYKLQKESNTETLPGGWQSGNIDLSSPEFSSVIANIEIMLKEIRQLYNIKKGVLTQIDNGWININYPGLNQLPDNYYHIHPNYFFSFVYYVKAKKDAGSLKMSSTYNSLEYILPDIAYNELNTINSSRILVDPIPGKLVAFPSWISHYVEPNLSTSDRISIAFDIKLMSIK
jgi:uncharacterized protein (TIGR02466 family)